METGRGLALAAVCGASAAIVVCVAVWAWLRRGRVPAAGAFAGLSAAQALWNLGHLGEQLAGTLPVKLLWDSLQCLPYGALAPAALFTAVRYTRVPIRLGWLWAFGVVTMSLAVTVGLLRLLGAPGYETWLTGTPPGLWYEFTGLDYLLALLSYGSLMLAAGSLLVASGAQVHGRGARALALSLGIPPLVMAAVAAMNVRLLGDRDVTPITFAVAALVAAWGLGRHELFEIMPVARGLILERLPVGVLVVDAAGRVADANPEAAYLLGEQPPAIQGRPIAEVLAAWPELARLAGGEQEITDDLPGPGPTADGRCFAVTWTPLRDPDGMPAGGSLLIRDVSDIRRARKEAESRLAVSEDRFRALFDQTFQSICLLDRDGRVLAANRAARNMLGPAEGELTGKELAHTGWGTALDQPGSQLAAGIARAAGGEFVRFESECVLNGVSSTFDVSLTPARDASGKTVQILLEARDVTMLRESQRRSERLALQLQSAQRNQALGRLASGVAHDFNNILTVVKGNLDLLKEELGRDSPQAASIDEILNAARAGTDITRQLLVFSKQQPFAARVVALAEALAPARALLRRLLGEEIIIEEDWPADLGMVRADPSQLQQVLLNLAINARDAMPNGGKLSIRGQNLELDQAAAAAIPGARPGRFVCLEIADTGSGMSDVVMSRLFEPFFTTKAAGQGTGLGLAIVQSVLEQNRGFIRVRSGRGCGTTFSVYLPRETALPVTAPPARVSRPRPAARSTVVVVEDQPAVRQVIERVLRHEGYVTHSFAGPRELLQVTSSFNPVPDLLLTDMVMPEMSGPRLADAVAQSWPNIKVLFVSGRLPNTPPEISGITAGTFLAKPFSVGELTGRIEETLREAAPWSGPR